MSIQFEVLDSKVGLDGTLVEVIRFPHLAGSADVRSAERLFYIKEAGMGLKAIRITLKDSAVRVDPGALFYMMGSLSMQSSTGGGMFKALKRSLTSGDSFFVNEITGTGQIILQPSFGHFLLFELGSKSQGIIVDKGMFFAGSHALDISSTMMSSVSSALFGGQGLFQTHIGGTGIAVLYSPVPHSEIQTIELSGSKLCVDGNFVVLRTDKLEYTVQKSSRTVLSTLVSGEPLFHQFQGTGTVMLAPTEGIYKMLATEEGLSHLAIPVGCHTPDAPPT